MSEVDKMIDCPQPCTMFKMNPRTTGMALYNGIVNYLDIRYPETTKISTDQYAYTWLNLVAEVGGYVGLFLGYSVYQMTDLVDILLQRNWVEDLKKACRNIRKK